MNYKMIKNDFLKSRGISLTLFLFITAASMLVSLGSVMIINLSGSIDSLMMTAKTPHFMQMHSGNINHARLEMFAKNNKNVDDFQILEFLNIENSKIIIGNKSLSGSVQDNGLFVQSKKFDYLLDLYNKVISVKEGEIYLPVYYIKDKNIRIGDTVIICGKKFTIAGFLRDSQMNSLLSSSKRFLVSETDYEKLKKLGRIEYLIEFRLKDISLLGEFETVYISSKFESNGPTITYPLFKTINSLSDGLMIIVILLVSVLVVAVSLMCIRFTLLAKIEDDYREIGVMKAIGLRTSDIKTLYIGKYAFISAIGSVTGLSLSYLFMDKLMENIRLNMGESTNSSLAIFAGITGVFIVFIAVIVFVSIVLRRFNGISAAEALRYGVSQEKYRTKNLFLLSKNTIFNTNVFLGIKDVLIRKRLYLTMLAILIISVFIIIVPQNVYNTISSKSFIRYMGIGDCDIRIDIQQTENILEKVRFVSEKLKKDDKISQYSLFITKSFTVLTDKNTEELIKIELGDHSAFPLKYIKGRAPVLENEIALSSINADEFGKTVSDSITIKRGGKETKLSVCGIYSDVTNGGKTAKAIFNDDNGDIMWGVIYAIVYDKSSIQPEIEKYRNQFSFAKVSGIDEYINQTFGPTKNSVKISSFVSFIIGLMLSALITFLFMKLLISKDKYPIAVMKTLGFSSSDIIRQYITRSALILIIGIITGTILANTLGESLAGILISVYGVSSFDFIINPVSSYIFSPLMIILVVILSTITGTSGAGRIKISESIKE